MREWRWNHTFVTMTALTAIAVGTAAPSTLAGGALVERKKPRFTKEFAIEGCTFVTHDEDSPGNPLFPLVPGQQLVLEGEDDGAEARVQITTCEDDGSNCSRFDGTPVPGLHTVEGGIVTRVIEEREWEDGELGEISHNFFARCEEHNAVFYLGEMVQDIEDGEAEEGDDAWEAGVDGARPGVIMPGLFLLGSRYFQEVAPDVALDRAEHVQEGLALEFDLVGEGETELEGCVEILETSPLDRRGSFSVKRYCPGVGLVFDDDIELVEKNF